MAYSTSEQSLPATVNKKWLDGRTVFEKTFDISGTFSGLSSQAHGIVDLDHPVEHVALGQRVDGKWLFLAHGATTATNSVGISLDDVNININAGTQLQRVIIVLRYVKKDN